MVDDELQGFADAATLKSRYGASSSAFLLGLAHPDHEVNFPVGIEDDRHLFIMAGSRAGKGTSNISSTLRTPSAEPITISSVAAVPIIASRARSTRADTVTSATAPLSIN